VNTIDFIAYLHSNDATRELADVLAAVLIERRIAWLTHSAPPGCRYSFAG
jgi:hypothetical protein